MIKICNWKKLYIVIAFFCCLCASGCTTIDIASDYDQSYDFGQLKTYAWFPGIKLDIGDGRINEDTLEMRIKRTVEAELSQKGFRKTDIGKEDFLLGFGAALNEPLYRDKMYEYSVKEIGTTRVIYEEKSEYSHPAYDAGSLILDVIDPDNNEIVWRGSAQANIQIDYVSSEKKKKRLKKAIHQILNDFPPDH